jgi:hypothetical protein
MKYKVQYYDAYIVVLPLVCADLSYVIKYCGDTK